MKRRRRRILLAVMLLLVVGAALETASRLYFPRIIRPRVREQLSEVFGCRAEFGLLRSSLLRGLEVRDLTLYDGEGSAILSARRLRLRPRLLPLILLRFDTKTAEFEDAVITFARNKAGGWNIAKVASSMKKRRKAGPPPLRKVDLADGKLAIRYAPGDEPKVVMRQINLALRLSPDGAASYRASALVPPSEKPNLRASGTYDPNAAKNAVKVALEHLPMSGYSSLLGKVTGIPIADRAGELDAELDIDVTAENELKGAGTATWKNILIEDESFSAGGDLALRGSFYSDMKGEPLYQATMEVSSSTLRLGILPRELTDIGGLIVVSNNVISTANLSGRYGGYEVQAMGNLSDFSSPELDLRISSTTGLTDLLEILNIYDKVSEAESLSGTVESELYLKGKFLEGNPPEENGLRITGSFALRDGAIKPRGTSGVKEIAGHIYLIGDELIVKGIQCTYRDYPLSIKGSVGLAGEPRVDLVFSSADSLVSMKGRIGRDALHLEPLAGNIGASTFSVSGTINDLDNPRLDLSFRGKIDLAPITRKVQEAHPEKAFLKDLLPKESLGVEGTVAGRPSSPKDLIMSLEGTSDSLEFKKWFINGVRFSAAMKDKVITFEHLKGTVNQGEIDFSGSIDMSRETIGITLDGSASGVNFSGKPAERGGEEIYGTLTGNIDVEGYPADLTTLSGTGKFSIERGKIWHLRFFQGLFEILSVVYPGIGNIVFDRIGGSFSVKDGFIESQDLVLDSPSVKLYPKGRMGLDGTLDFTVDVNLFDTRGNILKKVTGIIMNIPGQFMGVKLSGTIRNPQWRPVMLPFIKGLKKTGKRGGDLLLKPLPQ